MSHRETLDRLRSEVREGLRRSDASVAELLMMLNDTVALFEYVLDDMDVAAVQQMFGSRGPKVIKVDEEQLSKLVEGEKGKPDGVRSGPGLYL